MRTLAVVFRDLGNLKKWDVNHGLGHLLTIAKTPLGDRTYVSDNGDRTRVSFFFVDHEKDLEKMQGFVFDNILMLDIYSDFTVSWLKSKEQRKPTMRTVRESKFKSEIWRGTCSNCDAIFECDRQEIEDKIQTPTQYGMRGGNEYARIQCTECDHRDITFHFHKRLVEPPTSEEVSKG